MPSERPTSRFVTGELELARELYEEIGEDGERRYTIVQIAGELGVSRATIYRYLSQSGL